MLEGVSAIYKKQVGAGSWGVVWCCVVLNWVVSMSLGEKIFEQRPGGSEGLVSVSPQSCLISLFPDSDLHSPLKSL